MKIEPTDSGNALRLEVCVPMMAASLSSKLTFAAIYNIALSGFTLIHPCVVSMLKVRQVDDNTWALAQQTTATFDLVDLQTDSNILNFVISTFPVEAKGYI